MTLHFQVLPALFIALSQAACAQDPMPADLRSFIQQRALCDHLRGEIPDPPHGEAQTQVLDEIDRQCDGTDAALQRLKLKYADDAASSRLLAPYEPEIEAR